MIRSFRDRRTQRFFTDDVCPAQWRSFASVALRKLVQLNHAAELGDLRSPPGNRLELLRGDRAGQHSIRINDQWRVCFRWPAGSDGPEDVEITDYH